MTYALADSFGLLIACVLAVPVLVLPGYAMGHWSGLLGFRQADPARRWSLAVLLGLAVLPALTSVAARWMGLTVALGLVLAIAMLALPGLANQSLSWVSRRVAAVVALAIFAVAVLTVDIGLGEALVSSLLKTDTVKHAAVTRAIVEANSTPPTDPFFFRPERANYYYYFYTLSALVERLSFGLIDSRAAFAGLIPWVGVAMLALANILYERAGLVRRREVARSALLFVIMAVAGLQILMVLKLLAIGEPWRQQTGWINEQVISFVLTLIWVPHHLSGIIAAWVGFLILADVAARLQPGNALRTIEPATLAATILASGAAFASVVGLSVWDAFGAVAAMAGWVAILALEKRWSAIAVAIAAGVVSLALAAPDLVGFAAGTASDEAAVALRVRRFVVADELAEMFSLNETALRFVLLPLNYFVEAGFLLVGALAFWRRRNRPVMAGNEVARLVVITAIAGLLIASFVASVIANNDLGWRVILFAELAAVIWTAHLLMPMWTRAYGSWRRLLTLKFVPRPFAALLAIGLATTAYDLVMLRIYPLVHVAQGAIGPLDLALDRHMREAYTWLAANVDHDKVVQHNPDAVRAFPYGLYGRNPTAASDTLHGNLVGAPRQLVRDRLDEVLPVFKRSLSAQDVVRRLTRHKADIVVVTDADPAWRQGAAWVSTSPTLYRSERVRVIAVPEIAKAVATAQ